MKKNFSEFIFIFILNIKNYIERVVKLNKII